MANNLVTEAYLAANFSPKSGVTPGSDDHAILNCTEILARYNVTISPSTGKFCPKQSELADAALVVGDSYGGGIVAYIYTPYDPGYVAGEQHGIIATAADLAPAAWRNTWIALVTGATGYVLGTGSNNTELIVAAQASGNYAAIECFYLTEAGYSDWFLPSMYELHKLYLNRVAIGGFQASNYWSSTEEAIDAAIGFDFGGNTFISANKTLVYHVRPIRYF